MKQIKFRGKRLDNGQWAKGSLLQSEIDVNRLAVKAAICTRFANDFGVETHEIDPLTVGQFTGMVDKEEKEIFEGDIIREWLLDSQEPEGGFWWNAIVKEYKGCWCLIQVDFDYERNNEMPTLLYEDFSEIEVIGNIHDNPELTKQ
jgi:uncharacterized phage protein (TIGR01671 family)